MKKFLSAIFITVIFISVTGCSGSASIGTSETPPTGLATIISEESFICTVTDKHTEDRTKACDPLGFDYYEIGTETYYYVTAICSENTSLRFRTNETFYNACDFGDEFLITKQVIGYPVGGTNTRYCYKGEVLSGATLVEKSKYVVSDLSEYEQTVGFAEFVGVDSEFYYIVGFDEVEYHYMSGRHPATEMQYYVIAENADGNRLRFETAYDFWECSAIGDTLTIVAQQMKYALSGIQTNYYLNGSQLVNVTLSNAADEET